MSTPVFLAVLTGALLHAGWNSVIKLGLDRVSSVLLLAIVQGLIAVPLIPFMPAPAQAAWPWIFASGLLHAGYKIFLTQAYAHADLSQAYPLARGSAPFIVTIYSALVIGTVFSGLQILAIGLISGGLLIMALRGSDAGRMSGPALFFALGTACFTAGYTLVDGLGARVAGTSGGFMVWMVAVDTSAMCLWGLLARGRGVFRGLLPQWRSGMAAGAMSLASYWIAVWAFTQAPIALVAALRESSIVFAVLIAVFVMRETVGKWRWISALTIAAGVALMRL